MPYVDNNGDDSLEDDGEEGENDLKLDVNKLPSLKFFSIDGVYPVLTSSDIIDKERHMCFFCYFHAAHTPCGKDFQKFKECSVESPGTNNKKCEPLFQKFMPCFIQHRQYSPYFSWRYALLTGSTNKMMKVWFRLQKQSVMESIDVDL